jgi:hypothetical protein
LCHAACWPALASTGRGFTRPVYLDKGRLIIRENLKVAPIRCALAASLLLTPLGLALAGPDNPEFTYIGLGAMTCGQFLTSESLPALKSPYIQWVSGLLTGVAESRGSKYMRQMSLAEIAGRFTDHCMRNPTESVLSAAKAIAHGREGDPPRHPDFDGK